MTWDKYAPDIRAVLKDNMQIRDLIINMRDKGQSKEAAMRVSGADYEVVDQIYNMGKKRSRKSDIDPDGNE